MMQFPSNRIAGNDWESRMLKFTVEECGEWNGSLASNMGVWGAKWGFSKAHWMCRERNDSLEWTLQVTLHQFTSYVLVAASIFQLKPGTLTDVIRMALKVLGAGWNFCSCVINISSSRQSFFATIKSDFQSEFCEASFSLRHCRRFFLPSHENCFYFSRILKLNKKCVE